MATSPQLTYQRYALTQHAIVLLLLSLVVGALVIFVFGWDPVDVAIETAIGIAVWGGFKFSLEVRHEIPRGPLPPPPAAAEMGADRNGFVSRMALAIVFCAGLAWLADRFDIGAVFAPGQFAGYTCAYAIGGLLVARWERSTGQRVLSEVSDETGENSFYAIADKNGLVGASRSASRAGRAS